MRAALDEILRKELQQLVCDLNIHHEVNPRDGAGIQDAMGPREIAIPEFPGTPVTAHLVEKELDVGMRDYRNVQADEAVL